MNWSWWQILMVVGVGVAILFLYHTLKTLERIANQLAGQNEWLRKLENEVGIFRIEMTTWEWMKDARAKGTDVDQTSFETWLSMRKTHDPNRYPKE
jgi:hypothetical protein